MAARLSHVEGSIFLVEECGGTLLWEIEDKSQFVNDLPAALDSSVDSLSRLKLVHGDIRPWNIFYDREHKIFRIIDWGFSFFLDEDLCASPFWHLREHLKARGHKLSDAWQIDEVDARKTKQVVAGEWSYEKAWGHQADEMKWRPPWAKRE